MGKSPLQWHPGGAGGGGEWHDSQAPRHPGAISGGRPRRTMTGQEAARLFAPSPSSSEAMDKLLKAARNAKRVAPTDHDPLQTWEDRLRVMRQSRRSK